MDNETEDLLGAIVVDVRPMTQTEMDSEGWDWGPPPTVLVLSTGTLLYPSRDPEGNGPGALFGIDAKGVQFGIHFRTEV